jgi:hypothetical protein
MRFRWFLALAEDFEADDKLGLMLALELILILNSTSLQQKW